MLILNRSKNKLQSVVPQVLNFGTFPWSRRVVNCCHAASGKHVETADMARQGPGFFSSLLTMDSASFHGLSMDYPWDLMTFLAVFGCLWSSFFWSIQLLWQHSTSRALAQDDDPVLAAGKFPEHWDGEFLGFPQHVKGSRLGARHHCVTLWSFYRYL